MTSTVATKRAYKMLIDGQWFDKKETFPVENPANREVLADVPRCDKGDVDQAVRAAHIAFESGKWPKMTAGERGRMLFRVAELIREHADELAELETRMTGKPIRETRQFDIPLAAECFEYYAGLAHTRFGETLPTPGQTFSYTLREPIGVIGQIVSWNFPLLMAAWKIAPALAAGNTVIFKASHLTPLTTYRLGEFMVEAGFPTGVINMITSNDPEIDKYLSDHPNVDKVTYAGETPTGRLIMETAAKTIKNVSLELGGKSPNIVFADADIDKAIEGSLFAIYMNQGQLCSAGSRLFVEDSLYDTFVKKFVQRVEALKVGDPSKKDTQMGPLASREQMELVLEFIKKGEKEGAKLLTGGHQLKDLEGYYVEPTVFGNVKNDMTIAQEEILGPVVCIIRFKDDADAIRQANDTVYGMASAVWTRDLNRAHRFVRELKAGTVWINSYHQFSDEFPFNGSRQSGFGFGSGHHTLEYYTQLKRVYIDLNEKPSGWYGPNKG
jgi:acyl-CoA reductase-like NAD-dependent aldehyde dehydrogenase